MHAERDHLIRFIFPRLRAELLKRQIHLVDVDLRWGVTSDQDVMEVCREIINKCRPRFICLLGGRYGSIPFDEEQSITEAEIRYAVLNQRDHQRYSFFYFRDPATTASMVEEEPGEFREPPGSKNERKLMMLKQAIEDAGYVPRIYQAHWDQEYRRLVGLGSLGQMVYSDLMESILNECGESADHETYDEFSEADAVLEAFIEEKAESYLVGSRRPILDNLTSFAESSDDQNIFILTGDSGVGKSALLCKFYFEYTERHPDDLVIPQFIGVASGSTHLRQLLRHMSHKLAIASGSEENIPEDTEKLLALFSELLIQAAAENKVILILDALNQLDAVDNAHAMYWLPDILPSSVRIIISSLKHPALSALKQRKRKVLESRMKPLNKEDVRAIIEMFLSHYGKTMSGDQIEVLLEKPESVMPLYLRTALEELRTLGTYEEITMLIRDLPGRIRPLFQWILRRLEKEPGFLDAEGKRIGERLVRDFISYIAASRVGMSEKELAALIDPGDPRGNIAALEHLLRPYLMRRGELIDFFHGQLKEAVADLYLSEESERIKAHRKLAGYFEIRWKTSDTHALSELPYHLKQGRMNSDLESILTSLAFIEAKCASGMTYDLITDYHFSLRSFPSAALREYEEFLSLRASFFSDHPLAIPGEVAGEWAYPDSRPQRISEAIDTLNELRRPWLEKKSGGKTIRSFLTAPTLAVAFSSDSSLVLTGDSEGNVRVWERPGWKLKMTHSFSLDGSILLLHLFDDNSYYLIVPTYGEIRIVALHTGATVKTFGMLWDAIASYVAGESLLVRTTSASYVWSLAGRTPVKIDLGDPYARRIRWAGLDEKGIDQDQNVYDLKTGRLVGNLGLQSVPASYGYQEVTKSIIFFVPNTYVPNSRVFTCETPYVLVTSNLAVHIGNPLTVHSLPDGEIVESYNMSESANPGLILDFLRPVTVGHKRKLILVHPSHYKKLFVIDLEKKRCVPIEFDMYVQNVNIDPGEDLISVCLADNSLHFRAHRHALKLYSTETLEELDTPPCLPSVTGDSMISECGSFAILNRRTILDTSTGKIVTYIDRPDRIWSGPRGGDPFIGSFKSQRILVRCRMDGTLQKILYFREEPTHVRISADGKITVLGYGKHASANIIVSRGSETHEYVVHETKGDGLFVDSTPDCGFIAASCGHVSHIGPSLPSGTCIWLLNTKSQNVIRTENEIIDFINFIKFLPDSRFLVIGYLSGHLQLRSTSTLDPIWCVVAHKKAVRKIAASQDGALIASLGMDNRLVITRVSSGEILTAKPFSFIPQDCEFKTPRDLILLTPNNNLFHYSIKL